MIPTYRATFTNEPRNVALARNAIASFARLCGFDDDVTSEIKLAAGEALSNASEYGRGRKNGGFSVLCSFDDLELRIEIQDSGTGFETPGVATDSAAGIVPDERNRGFGIFIMRRLMDSVNYSRGGTRVRLVRNLGVPNRTPGPPTHSHHQHR